MTRRTYVIRKYYAVICSQCHEDIADEGPETHAEAEKARDIHKAGHRKDDAIRDRILGEVKDARRGKP